MSDSPAKRSYASVAASSVKAAVDPVALTGLQRLSLKGGVETRGRLGPPPMICIEMPSRCGCRLYRPTPDKPTGDENTPDENAPDGFNPDENTPDGWTLLACVWHSLPWHQAMTTVHAHATPDAYVGRKAVIAEASRIFRSLPPRVGGVPAYAVITAPGGCTLTHDANGLTMEWRVGWSGAYRLQFDPVYNSSGFAGV